MSATSYPTLPTYRGLPVPFVTRRQGEAPDEGPTPGYGIMLAFDVLTGTKYPVLVNDSLHRDEEGWLWQPSPRNMDGKPEFAAVSAERHRVCMDEARCQVCGESAVINDESSWLIPADDVPSDRSREIVSHQPPVCLDCLDISQQKCPHLRRVSWVHVLARETRRYGVVGDVYDTEGNIIGQGIVQPQPKEVAAMTLARKRIVALTTWRLA